MTGCGGGAASVPQTSALTAPNNPATVRTVDATRTIRRSGNATGALSDYASAVTANSPLGYFQLNDSNSTLFDSGANALSGLYGSSVKNTAAPITTGVTKAALFAGGSAYDPNGFAYTAKNTVFQPAHVTVEAWINASSHNGTNHDLPIVVYGTLGRGARYGLFQRAMGSGDCLSYQQRNIGVAALNVCTNTRISIGKTYHVVVTSDGTTVTFYLNGVLDKSVAYGGSIDYSPFVTDSYYIDGFQIGGANQAPAWGSASFAGTIAQVAVYGAPLTPSQVSAHFLAGQLVPLVTETPASADAFVDSIGVNAHFENEHAIYGLAYQGAHDLLIASGIRHLRESMTLNSPSYVSKMQDFASHGIRASYVTQLGYTQSDIQSWPVSVGSSFEGFEAPNEQDDVGNPDWLSQCIAYQKNLYSWVKSDPQIAQYPVIGPAIVGLQDFTLLGDQSAYMDFGNIHDYMNVFNPGTTGWGSYHAPYGYYGSISYNTNLGHVVSGSKPLVATETGYGTINGDPTTLDYRADLRYMTRLFFEQFNGGIKRSYTYEFMDEGKANVFANFGLVTQDLTPKPSYYGIKSLISALSDPGASFATKPLAFALTGFNNNVHHTLLQKRNGQYVLAIWLEVSDWITLANAGGDIIVPPQNVTLNTAAPFTSASISSMDDSGNFSTSALPVTGSAITIPVTDKITLLNLTP